MARTRGRGRNGGAATEAAPAIPAEELVALDELRPHPRNYVIHGEAQLAHLEASLRAHGCYRNVVCARDGTLLAGHGVVAAARRLGLAALPVRRLDVAPDDPRALAVLVGDNEVAQLREVDDAALAALLRDVRGDDVAALLGTGFDDAALAAHLLAEPAACPAEPAVAPPLLAGDAELEPGDEVEDAGADLTDEGRRLMELLRAEGLMAPFPWFGGKRRIAGIVWAALGDVAHYVEPFAGSLAVLLARPAGAGEAARVETVNDRDAYLCNFWRALARDPDAVARHAADPVNETDLFARHVWLVRTGRERLARLEADPDTFDAQVAGWWCWGLCAWIGSGWCAGTVNRKRPHLDAGRGVNRQLPHLGDGRGADETDRLIRIRAYLRTLAARLQDVCVCCGDWARVVTDGALAHGRGTPGAVGVFLDPPYADTAGRRPGLYAVDDLAVAHAVRAWAVAHGDDPSLRIVLCGYEGEHEMPASWRCVAWASRGAYQTARGAAAADTRGAANRARERLWFSPGCLPLPVP
jgi:hypothetical protein